MIALILFVIFVQILKSNAIENCTNQIICSGTESCAGKRFEICDCAQVTCQGERACFFSQWHLFGPVLFDCAGNNACGSMDLIHYGQNATSEILCTSNSENVCQELEWKNGGENRTCPLTIDQEFNATSNQPLFQTFKFCEPVIINCTGNQICQSSIFYAFDDTQLICDGSESCEDTIIKVVNDLTFNNLRIDCKDGSDDTCGAEVVAVSVAGGTDCEEYVPPELEVCNQETCAQPGSCSDTTLLSCPNCGEIECREGSCNNATIECFGDCSVTCVGQSSCEDLRITAFNNREVTVVCTDPASQSKCDDITASVTHVEGIRPPESCLSALGKPSQSPTASPTQQSGSPTAATQSPSIGTLNPTSRSQNPTIMTSNPTRVTQNPSMMTLNPTTETQNPTSTMITSDPTQSPSKNPTRSPTRSPTLRPVFPTPFPTFQTGNPTPAPTNEPTMNPTVTPNTTIGPCTETECDGSCPTNEPIGGCGCQELICFFGGDCDGVMFVCDSDVRCQVDCIPLFSGDAPCEGLTIIEFRSGTESKVEFLGGFGSDDVTIIQSDPPCSLNAPAVRELLSDSGSSENSTLVWILIALAVLCALILVAGLLWCLWERTKEDPDEIDHRVATYAPSRMSTL